MSPNRSSNALLLPYQSRWIQDRSRVKICEKSRRIGITWATAAFCVLEAGRGANEIWYVSYTEGSAKEFILDCVGWCKRLNIVASEMQQIILYADENDAENLRGVLAFQISFPSGKRITALTSSARNLRGKQGIVIIDEAAFHDNLPELLKAAFALLMWGGSVWIMSTHNGYENEFNRILEEVRDGKRPYSLHRITILDALAEGFYKRICETVPGELEWTGEPEWSEAAQAKWLARLEVDYGDGYREELYCEPARGGQSYLGRPLIESRMVKGRPVLRIERPDDWVTSVSADARREEIADWCDATLAPLLSLLPQDRPHGFGFDFGRYSDRSVIAPYTLCQDLERAFPFLVEMLCIPHEQQWQVLQYIGVRLPGFFRCNLDAGGNGAWVAEQALVRWGESVVECVQLSVRWYAENMPPFREAHERGVISYPSDLDVRNDLALIRRIDGVPMLPKTKNESSTSNKRRHGDAAVAMVLAYASSRETEAISRRWDNLT